MDCHELVPPGNQHVPFITGVTAPIMRYHPAIVAQAFATMGAMYPGRVGIGVGTAEPPNEMAIYRGEWPSNNTRLEMLEEALTVMTKLWLSDRPVSTAGKYYTLNNAILLTRPREKVPVYVSAIGPRAAHMAGRLGDNIISFANNPQYVKGELWPAFESGAKEAGKDPDKMERVAYLHMSTTRTSSSPLRRSARTHGTLSGGATSRAFSSGVISIFHSAEDFIKKIEEMKRMGYTHISVANGTRSSEEMAGVHLDEGASFEVWKDVLPHVR